MNAENPMLELKSIHQVFPDGDRMVEVLRNVNLTLWPGKMIAIMGPSGSGKSTLLRIAGGLLTPTKGQVLFEGTDLTRLNPAALAAHRRQHVGYVFQDYNLIANLTALENVALPLELGGVKTGDAKKAARGALASTGVAELADRWAGDLSGGQAQRVAVARALVGQGRIILADEPTGALDTVTSDQVMELLRARVDAGATCLLVTHEPRLAAWADQIVYLRDGQFISPDEYLRPARSQAEAEGEGDVH